MKLFGSTKNLIRKTKNGKNVPSLQVVEVVLAQYNLVDNRRQQKSFEKSKLNVEPSSLVFLKTYNTVFDEIIITFTEQNGRPLETEDKVNQTWFINKQK